LKGLLSEYYVGKPVRAKVSIPAKKHGLEVFDGELRAAPSPDPRAAAQPGALLLIKRLKFKGRSIEVTFDGGSDDENESEAEAPKASAPALAPVGLFGSEASESLKKDGKATIPSATQLTGARLAAAASIRPAKASRKSEPRVTLRFSHEISTRDLNLQSINRLLAAAVDVTSLAPKEVVARPAAETPPAPRPTASMLAERAANAQGISTAPITGSVVGTQQNVSELNIECSIKGTRLYIDSAFSGSTPHSVRLLMGVHTIFITAPGYESWEQKFFVPAGKAVTIRAELKPTAKP
jgi:hypothetical protein